jgi:hypothetical protein
VASFKNGVCSFNRHLSARTRIMLCSQWHCASMQTFATTDGYGVGSGTVESLHANRVNVRAKVERKTCQTCEMNDPWRLLLLNLSLPAQASAFRMFSSVDDVICTFRNTSAQGTRAQTFRSRVLVNTWHFGAGAIGFHYSEAHETRSSLCMSVCRTFRISGGTHRHS